MTKKENREIYEAGLKHTITSLGLFGVNEKTQKNIMNLINLCIDKSFDNGWDSAMKYSLTEIKTLRS